MERFEGNGAECMVRFIADGCKGRVDHNEKGAIVLDKNWKNCRTFETWPVDWLAEPCIYTPAEPVWREVTPGQALDAWLAGKTIQRQANSLDDAFAHGDWYQIEPRTSAMPYSRWDVQNSKYRVLED